MVWFDWDPEKAAHNLRKHGVSFDEAVEVFVDPLSSTVPDPEHSVGEERFWILGVDFKGRLLVVAPVDNGNMIRIISARVATGRERRIYEQEG